MSSPPPDRIQPQEHVDSRFQPTLEKDISGRVFCLGMNKTGTSSINHCFRLLNLAPIASPSTYGPAERAKIRQFYRHKNYASMLNLAERYKSFEDRPWNMWSMYRHLYQRFPDSRFILTLRDEEAWWRSTEHWISVTKPEALQRYQLHLRVQQANKESMVESYHRYNQEVEDYFAGTGRLLIMNMGRGDGWEKLCHFLGLPVPDEDFPHANRQKYSKADAKLLRNQKRLKHGSECQFCHEISIVKKKGPSFRHKRTRGRLSLKQIKRNLHPENLHNSLLARQVLNTNSRIINTLKQQASVIVASNKSATPLPENELAVVSCFFNPGRSQRRTSNFRRFLAGIKQSGVRCLVVELAFGSNSFEIFDHDDIIRLRSDHIMWHKERLLNIGIKRMLSEGIRKIAWMDGDIQFQDPHWPLELSRRLDDVNLCQVFETIEIHAHSAGPPMLAPSSVKYFQESGKVYFQPPSRIRNILRGMLKGGQSGFGWAARAEVLENVQLYEHAIVGGGDKLIMAASLSENLSSGRMRALTLSKFPCKFCRHRNQSTKFTADYLKWAQRWSHAVAHSVDYARLQISDMYHGDRSDRGYLTRHDILYLNDFNPSTDLTYDDSNCLVWSSTKKKELHRDIEAYFLSRREDI